LVVASARRAVAEVSPRPVTKISRRPVAEIARRTVAEVTSGWPIAEIPRWSVTEVAWARRAVVPWWSIAVVSRPRRAAEVARPRRSAARSASRPPRATARRGVAGVLRRFEVPAQRRRDRTGDDRAERSIIQLAVGVAPRLGQLSPNAAPQLGLDGRRRPWRRAIRPGCFGHWPLACAGTRMSAAALQRTQRHWR